MSARFLAPLSALSGTCALAYEVLWARMLGIQFGVSVFAAAVTVSAFMLGLAGGSAFMAGRARRSSSPLRLLALLEACIALFALALPWAVQLATPLIDAAAARLSPPQWYALLSLAGLLSLTLPAAAMGAGFPLLVEGFARRGASLGAAYGSNTIGAALGALLPLVLLPGVGWTSAVRAVAALNLIVAAGFFLLERRAQTGRPTAAVIVATAGVAPAGASAAPASAARASAAPDGRRPSGWVRLNYGVIGAAGLMLEMAWLRLFSLAMLRTEYVLALILAVMLLGMGLGSLIASRRPDSKLLAALPWCASGYALAGLWLLPHVSALVERVRFESMGAALGVQALLLVALTLPVTLSLGAWLPALTARFNTDGTWLYACNSLGAAQGGLSYVILTPLIGSAGALAVAAVLLLLPGLILGRARRAWAGVPLLMGAAWSVSALPPVRDFLPQAMAGTRDLYRYEDAVAITQVVEQSDGQRVLLTDMRRQDASTDPTAVFVQSNQSRLPLLLDPSFSDPGPRRVLFLGIGTGISLTGSLAFPNVQRSAVELSAGSIEAARRWFIDSNRRVLEHTAVHHDDARHFLAANTDAYDAIIGDVFHPDLAGAGSMLAVEQFERVRARLAPQGIFVQWLALNQFDQDTLAIVLRSFRQVFPDGQLFLDGMHLALVGPHDRWAGARAVVAHLSSMTPAQRAEATASEGDFEWLGRYWGPIERSTGPTQHEWDPVIEFLAPRLHYDAKSDAASVLEWLLARRPTIQRSIELLGVSPPQQEDFKRAYVGTELWVRSEVADWRGATLEADHLLGLAFEADPRDRWIAYAVSDRLLASIDAAPTRGFTREQFLRKILVINPWSVEGWRALWLLQREHADEDAGASLARILELSPMDRQALCAGELISRSRCNK
jgi:spermidine synthase